MQPHFLEWGIFSKQYLSPVPNRATGKRWILSGELPGKIIDGKPYVELAKFLGYEETKTIPDEVQELLVG